jgi:polyhydroxybutyrate depolymerase
MRKLLSIVLLLGVFLCTILVIGFVLVAGGSSRCRRPATGAPEPGTSARVITSSGEDRCYLLHVPEGFDGSRPVMLVLSLHGFSSRPEGQILLTGWEEIADREGFIVVFPQGTRFPIRWNATVAAGVETADDVQFIRDMLSDLGRLFAIDPERTFVNGMSNGGAMTHRLACEMAEVFGAAGVVAGPVIDLPYGCNPARPIPIIGFYGTDDPLVAYEGGILSEGAARRMFRVGAERARLYSAQEWAAGWAERNGCQLRSDHLGPGPDVSVVSYSDCGNEAEVVLYTIHGGGHTWPGGIDLPFLGGTTDSINASELMLEFFLEHPLEARD